MKPIAQVVAELSSMEQRALPKRPDSGADRRDGEDSDYRKAYGRDGRAPYGRPLRAAFYQYLPEAPRHSLPNVDGCREYVRQIDETIERGCWSAGEMDRLRQLKVIWSRRAKGQDLRYKTHGNLPGNRDRGKARPHSARAVITEIQNAINESNDGVKVARSEQKFVVDPKWPFGRFNPDRGV